MKTAFKAPSLRISPLRMVVFAKGISPRETHLHWPKRYRTGLGNIRGSTRMGPSTHQARLKARFGFAWSRWLGGLLAAAFLLGLTQAAAAQGAVRSVHGRPRTP